MSNNTNQKMLEILSKNPLEPIFSVRADDNAVLDIPDQFFIPKYYGVKSTIRKQSNINNKSVTRIPLADIEEKPDLTFTKTLDRNAHFSVFNSAHTRISAELIKMLMDATSEEHFISLSAYIRDRVNPLLFQYCFGVAIGHRVDTKDFQMPPVVEQFPQLFIEPSVFQDARAEAQLLSDPKSRRHIEIAQNFTASDREIEQRLGYFREDIGVNSHHWHWHLVYPTTGPRDIVAKDRRGELFYHMHRQLLARYDLERLCNNLPKVEPLHNLHDSIREGYFPKILNSTMLRTYPGRIANIKLQNINQGTTIVEIAELERWVDRIVDAIESGYVIDTNNEPVSLDPVKGIDVIGNLIEACDLSINSVIYGDLHNAGHNIISFAHDPDHRFLEESGVMGDIATAMRDPIFYRWHTFLNNIFNRHKKLLEPYSEEDLHYNGITVAGSEVRILTEKEETNILHTYWEKSEVDLAAGLDFGQSGNIYAKFTHLQHAAFEYRFEVENDTGEVKKGTCRIFICPKADERGTQLNLEEQRLMSVELDRFTVELQPGANTIQQPSFESSVTIPYERTFRRIGPNDQPTDERELAAFRFCGCGWPAHMLLPKGKPEGMTFDLFVMISDYEGDVVTQTNTKSCISNTCGDGSSYCGLRDKYYPDKRSMGYPFDRRLPSDSLAALANKFSNMKMTDVTIKFINEGVEREKKQEKNFSTN